MSFLSPIRGNHRACIFLGKRVWLDFVEGVVIQINLVEGAFEAFQGEVAAGGFQLALPQDDGVPPRRQSWMRFCMSRSRLRSILACQKGVLVLGRTK